MIKYSYVNKIIIIGNVGNDPEIILLKTGKIATFNVITIQTWKDKNSIEIKERKDWHKIIVYGKIADIAEKFIKKGCKVYIEGSLQYKKWTDVNNKEYKSAEINIFGGINNGTLHILTFNNNKNQEFDNSSHKYDILNIAKVLHNLPVFNNTLNQAYPNKISIINSIKNLVDIQNLLVLPYEEEVYNLFSNYNFSLL